MKVVNPWHLYINNMNFIKNAFSKTRTSVRRMVLFYSFTNFKNWLIKVYLDSKHLCTQQLQHVSLTI